MELTTRAVNLISLMLYCNLYHFNKYDSSSINTFSVTTELLHDTYEPSDHHTTQISVPVPNKNTCCSSAATSTTNTNGN